MKIWQLLFGLGLSFSFMPATFAQLTYRPPPERRQQQKTQSAATRGCSLSLPLLQLLAPSERVAATAARQPTFLFHLSGVPPHPLKISLTRPHLGGELWQQERAIERGGIVAVTPPPSVELEAGGDYILTAALPCDPARPDRSSYVRVVFQRVELDALTPEPIGGASDRVAALAAGGLWYDALALSYRESRSDFQPLLDSIGIKLR